VTEPKSAFPRAAAGRRLPFGSKLTWRILAVNMMAPVILVGGLFYLDRYRNELILAELSSLRSRAEIIAAALGEGAVIDNGITLPDLSPQMARAMIRRLSTPARVRTRLFDVQGDELVDSRLLLSAYQPVQVEDLPPLDRSWFALLFRRVYDFLLSTRLGSDELPLYKELRRPTARDFPEVMHALGGDPTWALRKTADRKLLLSAAVPVQRYKRILAAVHVTSTGDDIAQRLFQVRLTIFEAFALSLAITTTLSLYLAGTIAQPIRLLAAAADQVRRGRGHRHEIPDLGGRHDEIGELAGALKDMTEVLWQRMDAIEAFAADVAHEIKNPLTSLRSAVETATLVKDPEQRSRLFAIILDDVSRLDRLISDISDASRLDAELSRAEAEPVSMRRAVAAIAAVYRDSGAGREVSLTLACDPHDALEVIGIEGRLGQILRNLIANALSFSPPGGTVILSARREDKWILVSVEDNGPGIPPNKLEAIFERFYSERPADEKFGTHSGLGLSISRQIAEAHGGTLAAANRVDENGRIIGARFTLKLPAADLPSLPGPAA
jgi:two-component system sensor histidine kinase ChvG